MFLTFALVALAGISRYKKANGNPMKEKYALNQYNYFEYTWSNFGLITSGMSTFNKGQWKRLIKYVIAAKLETYWSMINVSHKSINKTWCLSLLLH